jgi:hypothetical protein
MKITTINRNTGIDSMILAGDEDAKAKSGDAHYN